MFMLFFIKKYFSFWMQASTKHGVHSPFVYNLITKGLNKKVNPKKHQQAIAYKNDLCKDKNTIEVTDFGAGSRVFTSNKREISKIAKNAGISNSKIKILLKLGDYFNFKQILEIGTSLGIGTYTLAISNPNAKITTLEGCPETLKTAKKYLTKHTKNTINFIEGNFSDTLDTVLHTKYDLIYFDGNHQKEATINYFEKCLKVAYNDSIFIFDDIYWSEGMTQAWEYIKKHPKVKITVDVFHLGIVFFRKEQVKENFKIRV